MYLIALAVFSLPPAVSTIAVLTSVYAIIQALKLAPWFQPYLQGWIAVAINVSLNAFGTWIVIPADQFWTLPTITMVIVSALGSAGIHGTVKSALASPPASSAVANVVKCLIPFLVISTFLSGCNTATTSTPTAPANPAAIALNVLNEVQSDTLAVENAVVAAVQAGLITPATGVVLGKDFKQEALDASLLATAISTATSSATIQPKVDALMADLQQAASDGALGIKDAKTQATVSAAIAAAEIVVNGILNSYSTAK